MFILAWVLLYIEDCKWLLRKIAHTGIKHAGSEYFWVDALDVFNLGRTQVEYCCFWIDDLMGVGLVLYILLFLRTLEFGLCFVSFNA